MEMEDGGGMIGGRGGERERAKGEGKDRGGGGGAKRERKKVPSAGYGDISSWLKGKLETSSGEVESCHSSVDSLAPLSQFLEKEALHHFKDIGHIE